MIKGRRNKKAILGFMVAASLVMPYVGADKIYAADDVNGAYKVVVDGTTKTDEVGNVTYEGNEDGNEYAYWAEVTNQGDGTFTAGGITATNISAAYVNAEGQDSSADASFDGDIKSGLGGVSARADEGARANVTVNGDVDVATLALDAVSFDDSYVKFKSEGNITSDMDGIFLAAYDESTTDMSVNGNVEAKDVGIYVNTYGNGTAAFSFTGDMTVGDKVTSNTANDSSELNFEINGNVKSENEGVLNVAYDDASLNYTHVGNIEAELSAYKVSAGGNTVTVTDITGNVIGNVVGMDIYSTETAKNDVKVKGDVLGGRNALLVYSNDESENLIFVEGDLIADEFGVDTTTDSGAKTDVVIMGNVLSEGYGIYATADEGAQSSIVIDGTVEGDIASVYSWNNDNVSLTVWKIVANECGALAGYEVNENGKDVFVQDRNFERNINYIIKVEQPAEGCTLSALCEDGSALMKDHDYDIAKEGDKVILKIDVQEGYKLTGAYNGLTGEKVNLLIDDSGNYYVCVPGGGGVYLSATTELQSYGLDFYDDDGNTMYTIAVPYGSTITMPAPVREGYEFLYWEGSRYYAGDKYVVTGPHKFTAIWKKIEAAKVEETPVTEKPQTETLQASSPKTGDETNVMLAFVMTLISGIGIIQLLGKKRRS